MFGYIKIYEPELLVKELKIYKSIYCGLCKKLKKSFGLLACLSLSYDLTFLALLSISLKNDLQIQIKYDKCIANPFKKCHFCISCQKDLNFAAAVCVQMTYYKLLDDIKDTSVLNLFKNRDKVKKFSNNIMLILRSLPLILKKLSLYLSLQIFKFPYKKAAKQYPRVRNIIKTQMKNQDILEGKNHATLDESAEPTALMLSGIFELLSEDTSQKKILKQFGYFIGKWIYLTDAADDLSKDIKNASFNPFTFKLKEKDDNIQIYCNQVLNQVHSQILLAYNLLETNNFQNILGNIIKLGLKNIQNKVLKL